MRVRLLIFISFLFLNSYLLNAQVGIDTDDPDPSAVLHVESADKGVLLPRVGLSGPSDVSTIVSPATGLVVFNTDAVVGLDAGFCYFDGSVWVNIKDDNSTITDWKLSGNNISSADFLGSTNSEALEFRVNNIAVGRFELNNSIAFGNNASTLDGNAIAIGGSSLSSRQSTIAIGSSAAARRDNSIAIGKDSDSDGFEAVALGAGSSANAVGSTAIGRGAIANGVDAIVLGNSSSRVGIGTSSPSSGTKLHVVGSIKIEDGTEGLNKVLVSDADGKASWQNQIGNIYSEMYTTTNQVINPSTTTRVNFTSSDLSSNMTVNLSNDAITIPSNGIYEVSFTASLFQSTGVDRQIEFFIRSNNTTKIGKSQVFTGGSDDDVSYSASKTFIVNLSSGTSLSLWYTSTGDDLLLRSGAYIKAKKLSN